MVPIEIFPWNDNLNTGVANIDEQHQKLVQLLNRLASDVEFQSDRSSDNLILNELADYAVYHFQTEEALWRKYLSGDVLETAHKDTHNGFVSTVLRLKAEPETGGERRYGDLISFLTRWLLVHILTDDRYIALVVCAMQSGMTLEAAKLHAGGQIAGQGNMLVDIILSIFDKLATNTVRLVHEINARKQSSQALVQSQTQLNAVLDSTSEMIWSVDSERFALLMFNRELSEYFLQQSGIQLKTGMRPDDMFATAKVVQEWYDRYERAVREGPYSVEYTVFANNRTLVLSFSPFEQDGVISGVSIFGRDITASKKAQDEINMLAFYDPLTRLPNRRLLLDRLKQAMATSIRNKRYGALLFIDLDDFKTINDTRGHVIGDLLLQQVAERLSTCVREGDTVARLGGDEFVVMLGELGENVLEAATQATTVGEKILATLNQSYQLDRQAYHSTASIGVTLFPEQQGSIDVLLKRADLAMYQAKAAGRNTLRFFDPAMQATATIRAALEADLRVAVAQSQFILYYQAQVVGEGRLTGAEALVRWQHPERGLVSPAEFIPVAEDTGLILHLGHWVLETACNQLAMWADQPDLAQLTVAVNVSARQFHQRDFVDQVLALLAKTGASPNLLKLELTESLLVENVEGVIAKMNALKARGVGFALDDFGTGYSSLSYLKRLPLDQLKIDQGFVKDILTDTNDAAIAKMVVALAESLGLTVIAEGVEIEAQRAFLARQGCHAYQGYLFSRPLPLHEFEKFVCR